ncbi:hypothetical protein [Nocardioides litoris]|uniref:hypothetical protein n=1 Tax=Nocardioides litoris TaxID=1926648 RepID=UPI001123CF72|nr:hypothetical protein [Nocardioides litoris]
MSTRYQGTVGGHQVELEFDRTKVFVNEARLRVDGQEVDRGSMVYGDKTLRTTLADGTELEAVVHSGMVGEPSRPQVRTAEGSWTDLTEV